MSLRGRCACGNIGVHWQTIDYSLVPRACNCTYCSGHGAAWVSKPGSRFEAVIRRRDQYRVVRHGNGGAEFHECANCGAAVFVTARLHDTVYGALNARLLDNPHGFADALTTDFGDQTAQQKQDRWRLNWCAPVVVR